MSGLSSGRVFISYRRQESSLVGRLYDRLADRLGEDQVFMDVDTIALGVDFAEVITQAVSSCEVLLAVIGPRWLTATDQDGRRRLDDPDDIVHLEIATALERNIRVIPILVEGAAMPRRQELPEGLAGLAWRNALSMRHETFRSDADRLVAALEGIVGGSGRAATASSWDSPNEIHAAQSALLDRLGLQPILNSSTLTLSEQELFLQRVKAGLDDLNAEDRRSLAVVLTEFKERDDLSYKIASETERLLANLETRQPEVDVARKRVAKEHAKPEVEEQASQLRKPKIFLCYRREDTQWAARSIYESLSAKYGHERVFRDIDSTPAGVRFSTWIESRVGQCSVMIVLIGDAWSSAKDHAGQRRLELPKDWVRQEIEAALRRDIPIIPVRVQGARMPSDDELPSSIADLASFQSAEVTDSRWAFDVGLLIQAIDDLIGSGDNR